MPRAGAGTWAIPLQELIEEGVSNLPRELGKLQTSGSVRTFIEQWDVAEVPVLYVRSVNCDEIAPRGLCVEKVFKIVAAHLAQLARKRLLLASQRWSA